MLSAVAAGEQAWSEKKVNDKFTSEPLDKGLVQRGKAERWVCSNKGDTENLEIHCCFVCQEVKTYKYEDFFAATPQIATLRIILSSAAEGTTCR